METRMSRPAFPFSTSLCRNTTLAVALLAVVGLCPARAADAIPAAGWQRTTLSSLRLYPSAKPDTVTPEVIPASVADTLRKTGLLGPGHTGTTLVQYAIFDTSPSEKVIVFTDDDACPAENGASDLAPTVGCPVHIVAVHAQGSLSKTTVSNGCSDLTIYPDENRPPLVPAQNGTYYRYDAAFRTISAKSLYLGRSYPDCQFTAKVPR
ncbi:hypothetical protein AA0312_1983 [Acetobacter tropicalis NRIC 0312]|uniref:Uncharacterized protein n=2 Tax=Acetobacter tropicalis TaxID=104102 RepID=A0A511FS37_9PROT|nr:hypothetical protein ATR1_031d0024 [Acetobacter tropicalis]GBR70697.1 hypothetical protein AA0312_1983 [Acetobacter tropicalis NRIC 0312]GEL51762.1 hypothetical protein ATR01nite_28370 [Acetobacter tropicalis]